MAINTLTFGDVHSADYGVYISGEGVFNAPKRAVNSISIPGRNGNFILDEGRFENISVSYRVICFEKTLSDFRDCLANFRNALASQKGYQRLTDTFHPDEYRIAAFVDGFTVDPIKYNTAADFTITFECKPQRWLMSGEAPLSVTSGDTILNPTKFDASPLLEVYGYGLLHIGSQEIEIQSAPMGDIVVAQSVTQRVYYPPYNTNSTLTYTFDDSNLEQGDPVDATNNKITLIISRKDSSSTYVSYSSAGSESDTVNYQTTAENVNVWGFLFVINIPSLNYVYGTSQTDEVHPSLNVTFNTTDGSVTNTSRFVMSITYDGAHTITFQFALVTNVSVRAFTYERAVITVNEISASSSRLVVPNPCYIDCDIGEVYIIESGEIVTYNALSELGSELPVIPTGSTEITFDNTITQLAITPRWWKI